MCLGGKKGREGKEIILGNLVVVISIIAVFQIVKCKMTDMSERMYRVKAACMWKLECVWGISCLLVGIDMHGCSGNVLLMSKNVM